MEPPAIRAYNRRPGAGRRGAGEREARAVQDILSLGPPDAAVAAILVHGRDRDPEEMRDLARRLDLPGIRFLFPRAPGRTWYPVRYYDAREANEPALTRAIETYGGLVDTLLAQGRPPERLVLGGFSQGACLTAELLMRRPRRYGAAILWTGGLIGPDGTHWPAPAGLAGLPVYLSSSETDDWVEPGRVRQTEAWLARCGAAVELAMLAERDHRVSDAEIDGARAFLIAHGLGG